MKRLLIVVALALVAGFSCLPLLSGTVAAQTDRNVNGEFRTGSGKKLVMDLRTGGAINITGVDGDAVTINAYRGGRDGLEAQVDFNQDETGVRVHSHYDMARHNNFSSDLRFTVKVPKQTDIEID